MKFIESLERFFSFNEEDKQIAKSSILWYQIVLFVAVFSWILILYAMLHHETTIFDISIILGIATFIIAFFIYYYNHIIRDYIKIKTQLKLFNNNFENINNIEDFKNNYATIGKNIRNIDYIKSIWWEFCETLIIKREDNSISNINSYDIEDNPITVLKNTAQVELYINPETIIEKQSKTELMESIPSILTGVGLAGTFLAITVALFGFNLDQIEQSVQSLLGGLSIKFISSLAGISTSIIFILIKAHFSSNLSEQIANIQLKLNEIFPRRTAESYLCDLLESQKSTSDKFDELQESIDDQTNSLKQFFTNTYSDAIKNAVSEGLSNAKPDLIDAINVSMEKVEQVKNEIIEVLNNLNTSLSGSISQSIKVSLDVMNSQLNNAISELVTAMTEFKNLKQESAAGLMEKMITELKSCMFDLKNSLTDAVVGGSGDTITSLQTSLKDAASYMMTLKDTFNGFMDNMKEQAEHESRQRNEAVNQTINDTIQKVSEVNTNVQKCIDEQSSNLNEWLSVIKTYIDEIHANEVNVKSNYSELLNKLESSISSQTNVLNSNERIMSDISSASSNIASASSNLMSASNNVSDVIEMTEQTSNNLTQSLESSRVIVERIESTLNKNIESLETMRDTVTNLNNILATNIQSFADKSKDFQAEMFNEFAKGAQDALGHFGATINEQKELMEELAEQLDSIKDRR